MEMKRMEIVFGNECDIVSWMNLVNKVKENFPGLETEDALNEHRNTVLDFMSKEAAICAKSEDKVVVTTYREGVSQGANSVFEIYGNISRWQIYPRSL